MITVDVIGEDIVFAGHRIWLNESVMVKSNTVAVGVVGKRC